MKRSVDLIHTIKPTYSKILAKEKAIQKDTDKTKDQVHQQSRVSKVYATNKSETQRTVSNSKSSVSNSPVITYAPVIHINGGSPTAQTDFMKMMKDNQPQFEQFLKKIFNSQQRLSYNPV